MRVFAFLLYRRSEPLFEPKGSVRRAGEGRSSVFPALMLRGCPAPRRLLIRTQAIAGHAVVIKHHDRSSRGYPHCKTQAIVAQLRERFDTQRDERRVAWSPPSSRIASSTLQLSVVGVTQARLRQTLTTTAATFSLPALSRGCLIPVVSIRQASSLWIGPRHLGTSLPFGW